MNIVTRTGHEFDVTARCALAYVAACVSAVFDYVERTTGRCDYDDYSGLVSVEKVQELSRAKSTGEHARKIVADAELMHQLHNCSQLVVLAKDLAASLASMRVAPFHS